MKKLLSVSIAFALSLSACMLGCSSSGTNSGEGGETAPAEQPSSEELEAAYLASTDAFASVFASSMLSDETDNACVSPISLYYSLAMLASGLADDAQSQVLKVLQVDDASQLEDICRFGLDGLIAESDQYKLAIADSLWVSNDYALVDRFEKTAEEQFDAEIFSAEFGTKQADSEMSKWVQEKTNGLLSPIFQTNKEQIASLINTIYFKDAWVEQFSGEQTALEVFHAAEGDVETSFMKNTVESCGYADTDSYSMAELYFTSGATATFYLPKQGSSPQSLVASPEAAMALLADEPDSYPNIIYSIPKFSFSTNMGDLIPVLKNLGIIDAFSNPTGTAFDDMLEYAGEGKAGIPYVSDVRQETNISVSEEGVEAAAYTEVGMQTMSAPDPSPPIEFKLDRPFLFKICAPDSTVLFVGVVANPAL